MNSWVSFLSFFFIFTLTFGYCPNDSVEFRNFCYYFFSNATQFADAEYACNGINGHLASIHDGFTNALLTSEGSKHFNDSTTVDFWIGLNSLMSPGNWSWTDNSTFDFKGWAPTEPKNSSMSGVSLTIKTGYWGSADFVKTKPYVCETTAITAPTTLAMSTTPSYPAYMNCTEGWIYFEPTHSCYGHDGYNMQYASWSIAEQYCANSKANLPSIHSYDEARFLSTLFTFANYGVFFWTGLYSNDNEVSWRWSDKSTLDYLPWGSGYPNRSISSCAYMHQMQLFDDDCGNSQFFICKKPAVI